jgi:hypothetical protein
VTTRRGANNRARARNRLKINGFNICGVEVGLEVAPLPETAW